MQVLRGTWKDERTLSSGVRGGLVGAVGELGLETGLPAGRHGGEEVAGGLCVGEGEEGEERWEEGEGVRTHDGRSRLEEGDGVGVGWCGRGWMERVDGVVEIVRAVKENLRVGRGQESKSGETAMGPLLRHWSMLLRSERVDTVVLPRSDVSVCSWQTCDLPTLLLLSHKTPLVLP